MKYRAAWSSTSVLALLGAVLLPGDGIDAQAPLLPPPGQESPSEITVSQGTSMATALSPDGKTLVIDLQGTLWVLPAEGGEARRITDYYNDARQPVWSPDGSRLAYFAFRDGGYHLWTVGRDGRDPVQLTAGSQDEREPVFSPDGSQLAFASDRGGKSYDIWVLDLATRALRRITNSPREDRMPTWIEGGKALAFLGRDDTGTAIHVASLDTGRVRLQRKLEGRVGALASGPGDVLAWVTQDETGSRLTIDGRVVSDPEETVFPFRPSWSAAGEIFYTADGEIRRRGPNARHTVPFAARLEVVTPDYPRARRDWDSTAPRRVLGIDHPAISPDGRRIIFTALGKLHLLDRTSGEVRRLGEGTAMASDPAWSSDGSQIVYSSDKGGGLPQLWLHDLASGTERQLTRGETQPLGAAFSPDGKQVAFLAVNGRWGAGAIHLLDLESNTVRALTWTLDQPGQPVWSRDGSRLAVTLTHARSGAFREGANQIYVIPLERPGDAYWSIPEPDMSIDTRGGGGPAWSPDGTKMAAVYEGLLKVWPVAPDGRPLGPPRAVTAEASHFPTWAGDSKTLLFQASDKLKTLDLETGTITEVPLALTYREAIPEGRRLVHVSGLVDGLIDELHREQDITIEGNRILSVRPHDDAAHAAAETVIDGTGLTAMPGLIENHAHVQKDFGSDQFRAWLAYGVTTVRDPGNQLYDGIEFREAAEAGSWPSPRIYTTGPLYEWQRVYYKMGLAVSSMAQLERELDRARALHFDLLKS